MFFPINFLDKASKGYWCSLQGCTIVFQLLNACSYRTCQPFRREGNSQTLRRVVTPIFQTTGKKPLQSKVHTFGSLIQTSFTFHVQAAFTINDFTHVGVYGQHTHTHNSISVNQSYRTRAGRLWVHTCYKKK